MGLEISHIEFFNFRKCADSSFQRFAEMHSRPEGAISGVWGYVTNKHLEDFTAMGNPLKYAILRKIASLSDFISDS